MRKNSLVTGVKRSHERVMNHPKLCLFFNRKLKGVKQNGWAIYDRYIDNIQRNDIDRPDFDSE